VLKEFKYESGKQWGFYMSPKRVKKLNRVAFIVEYLAPDKKVEGDADRRLNAAFDVLFESVSENYQPNKNIHEK
jgi:hypothetical protein